mmetsp:Transcript_11203/g.33161  ORF Transcript_11203/g.33161 Transcript_11203/m.33161 type:complete len:92 (-) Transcript_11203:593-868(-)
MQAFIWLQGEGANNDKDSIGMGYTTSVMLLVMSRYHCTLAMQENWSLSARTIPLRGSLMDIRMLTNFPSLSFIVSHYSILEVLFYYQDKFE